MDPGAIALLQAIATLAFCCSSIWALFWHRNQMAEKTAPWLCIGNLLAGISLYSETYQLSSWMTWGVDLFGILGASFIILALYIFAGSKFPLKMLGLGLFISAVTLWQAYPSSPEGWIARSFIYSSVVGVLGIIASMQGFRKLQQEFGSWSTLAFLMPTLSIGIFFVFRAVAIASFDGLTADMTSGDTATELFLLGSLACVLFLNLGISGLSVFRLILRIKDLSVRDPLTGALNRRALVEALSHESLRVARHKQAYSIVMIDLDHFKSINDTWGHAAGDGALKFATEILGQSIREIDGLARWGGEEFCCLLPMTNLSQAQMVAERMRSKLTVQPFMWEHQPIVITASLGVATSSISGENHEDIIKRADAALYEAKRSGRNRVVCAPPMP